MYRNSIGMPLDARPWTGRSDVHLLGVPNNENIRNIIDIAWWRSTNGLTEAEACLVRECLKIDISQSLSHKPWSKHMTCLTTSSVVYSYAHDRVVTDPEKFFCLGFCQDLRFESMASGHLKDLAGDAMALPSVGSALCSLFLCAKLPGVFSLG